MLLGAVLAVLALPLFAAPASEAARTEFFGIASGPPLDVQDRQAMAAARIQTDRFLLTWRVVEPTRGTYRWASNDLVVGGLASRGIRPVPFVWGSPSWVGSGNIARPPLDSPGDRLAWRDFLKAAVARYGPGGSYWTTKYRQQFGASATPLPVQSWQIWNEPNLKRYFAPTPSASQYAVLLDNAHTAIKGTDPKAQIVLAGLFTDGDVKAWTYLGNLYGVAGARQNFDVAAVHPYACNLEQTREGIAKFRQAMTNNSDRATPIWITELAWGSGPPDQFCKNKGLTGQRDLLASSFRLILEKRTNWNIQRLFWFLWRDPPQGSEYARLCSICGTAGLLRSNRTAKPAYNTFLSFTAETTPPVATITAAPTQGSFINDRTPTFSFASNESGSTFVCRFDAAPFTACSTPFTRGMPLADGAHTFSVKAIDAPGNESQIRSRSFTVDTVAPQTTIASGPAGSTPDTTPTFTFTSSEAGSTFTCRFDTQAFAPCSGPGASHTPSTPLTPGSHSFDVRATDKATNTDPVPARRTFTITA